MTRRESFVARFSKDQAGKFEEAAAEHVSPAALLRPNPFRDIISAFGGDVPLETEDKFLTVISVAIDWECATRFREHQGITVSPRSLVAWLKSEGGLPHAYRAQLSSQYKKLGLDSGDA